MGDGEYEVAPFVDLSTQIAVRDLTNEPSNAKVVLPGAGPRNTLCTSRAGLYKGFEETRKLSMRTPSSSAVPADPCCYKRDLSEFYFRGVTLRLPHSPTYNPRPMSYMRDNQHASSRLDDSPSKINSPHTKNDISEVGAANTLFTPY